MNYHFTSFCVVVVGQMLAFALDKAPTKFCHFLVHVAVYIHVCVVTGVYSQCALRRPAYLQVINHIPTVVRLDHCCPPVDWQASLHCSRNPQERCIYLGCQSAPETH